MAHGIVGAAASKVAAIALANKMRGWWAMMARGERLREPVGFSVNEIAPDIRRDVKVGRANSTNAEPVDPVIRTTHLCQRVVECVLLIGT